MSNIKAPLGDSDRGQKVIISFDKLEEILRRETGVIAEEDVAILMLTIYHDAGAGSPQRLLDEAEANNEDS